MCRFEGALSDPCDTSLDKGDTFLLGNIFAFHSFECRLTFLKIFDRFLFDFCDVLQGEESEVIKCGM